MCTRSIVGSRMAESPLELGHCFWLCFRIMEILLVQSLRYKFAWKRSFSKLKWDYPTERLLPTAWGKLPFWCNDSTNINQRFSSPDMGTIKQWSCCEVFRSFTSTGCWQQVLFHHICSGPAKKVRHYSHLQSLLLNSQGGLGCWYLDCKIMVLRTRGPGCSALCKESASMFGEGILTLCTYSSLPLDPTLQIFLHALKQRCKCMFQFKWFPLDSCV